MNHPDVAAWSASLPDPVRAVFDRRLDRLSTVPIAVAFSGGGDSLALLLAARTWACAVGRPVIALCVDHGLQAASRSWTQTAGRTAHRLGVPFRALNWIADKPSGGLPAAARKARHALLAGAAREAGAGVILLGHTLDDVMEAGLMRAEGSTVSSPREWSPSPVWPEGRGLFLLRPLLTLRRADLRDALGPTGLGWLEDPANDDPRFARARARRSLADSPAAKPVVLGQHPPAEDLEGVARLAVQAVVDDFGVIRIDRRILAQAPAGAARRFTSAACVCAGGGDRLPRAERVQRLVDRIGAGDGVVVAGLAGARIETGRTGSGPIVQFMRSAGDMLGAAGGPVRLGDGLPAVWDGRFELRADVDGVTATALRGKARRLGPGQRAALSRCAASARPTLPVVSLDGESVTCPILADSAQTRARALVGQRLLGACGAVAREASCDTGPHGEPGLGALS